MKNIMILGLIATLPCFDCAASDQGDKLIAPTLFVGSVIVYQTIGYFHAHKKASQEIDDYIELLHGYHEHRLTQEQENILSDMNDKLIGKEEDGSLILTSKQKSDLEEIRNCLALDNLISSGISSGAIRFNNSEK